MFRKVGFPMDGSRFEKNTTHLKSERQELKRKGIKIQLTFLEALEYHHRMWANNAGNSEIERIHIELVQLFQRVISLYKRLLTLEPSGGT